jgi:hypothetical protein
MIKFKSLYGHVLRVKKMNTGEDKKVKIINAAANSQLQISEIDTELILLNNLYGEKVPLLSKKQQFKCKGCGYQEDIVPHEKILNGKYAIKHTTITEIDEYSRPINSYMALGLIFYVDCRCRKNNEVPSVIGIEQMLRLLRQEKNFIENGKPQPYKDMVI